MVMVPLDLIFSGTLAARSALALAEVTGCEVAAPPEERESEPPQALRARPAEARPASSMTAGRVREVIEDGPSGYAVRRAPWEAHLVDNRILPLQSRAGSHMTVTC